ncbi:NAD(P)/FAD-dependent oxidoreductase [Aliidiomarina sanyensis]|uniref:FAD dependent oxidoreductase domain-containing protein n=1 Tax=Aliidiomarina sanyensis TaxID=1249555 RepID=A0A432WIJ4_9GAMM|nr:FAD-binding oxidoreductase [Aliidiomarina sanyensis]RUO33537.1 hypothetical protein CWE11_06765 [Aliidiomarina sanyensis]
MYDPLQQSVIPRDHERGVHSYWAAHTVLPPVAEHALPDRTDVVVIGAGYTGLNAAITLARDYQREVVLIDAGAIGAGCSSRNAGFLLPGTGRLGFADYQRKFGADVAQAVQNEFAASLAHVDAAVDSASVSCDLIPSRYLRLAHSAKMGRSLQAQQALYQPTLLDAEWVSPSELQETIPGISWSHGALAITPARSVNPRALVGVYLEQAQTAGVLCVPHHPVIDWQTSGSPNSRGDNAPHRIVTEQGAIRCNQVLICANGYLSKQPFAALSQRHFPVLSSILVTRPLTAAEQAENGLRSTDMMMDTRTLKYYYRLLPDGRLLFGGRGAVSGSESTHPRHRARLERALAQTFPRLRQLTTDFYWSGWVSVSFDAMPRVYSPSSGVFTSMGYCGAGVAFASLAGKRLAQKAAGDKLPELPFYHGELPRFPFPSLRRAALRAMYAWSALR